MREHHGALQYGRGRGFRGLVVGLQALRAGHGLDYSRRHVHCSHKPKSKEKDYTVTKYILTNEYDETYESVFTRDISKNTLNTQTTCIDNSAVLALYCTICVNLYLKLNNNTKIIEPDVPV